MTLTASESVATNESVKQVETKSDESTNKSVNESTNKSTNESANELIKKNETTNESSKNPDEIKVDNVPKTVEETIKVQRTVKVGSRKSKLAVIQAEHVIEKLNEFYRNKEDVKYKFELNTITTKGDKILDVPLSNIGSKALFTKELEVALIDKEIDLIVHSCKDLPTNLPAGLCIAAILRREMAEDVIVIKKGLENKFKSVQDFLKNHHLVFKDKSIGTSSLRRIAQLKRLNKDIKIEDIRGNIDTRLKKLDDENSPYSALVLAGAGLKRGGFGHRITAPLNEDWWYAVGQGALAVECREGDEFIQNLLYPIIDHRSTFEVVAERSFMQYLEGGCSIPLGVRSVFVDDDDSQRLVDIRKLKLSGTVISLNGENCVKYECKLGDANLESIDSTKIDCTKIVLPTNKCPIAMEIRKQYYSCAKLGIRIAMELQNLGARSILDEINKNRKPLED